MSNNLLLDSKDLLILQTKLAVVIGDRHAIALQQIHYWIELNEKAVKETHFFDGYWWVINTWSNWLKRDFPFWSDRTLRRIFKELELDGLIVTRPHNDNNIGVWVRIDYDKLNACATERGHSIRINRIERRKASAGGGQNDQGGGQNDQRGVVKTARGGGQNDQPNEGGIATDYLETKTEIKESDSAEIPAAAKSAAVTPPVPPVRIPDWIAEGDPKKPNQVKQHSALDAMIARLYSPASYLSKDQLSLLSAQIVRYDEDTLYKGFVDAEVQSIQGRMRRGKAGAPFIKKVDFVDWLLDESGWLEYESKQRPQGDASYGAADPSLMGL